MAKNPLDFLGGETEGMVTIIIGFRSLAPLDMRRRESLYIICDMIWHNSLPHLLPGDTWDPDMQRILSRIMDAYSPNSFGFNKNPNAHWIGPVRLAIAPHVDKDKYYYDLRARLTQTLWVTQKFFQKFPTIVVKPSIGIRHKQLGAAGPMPSITRFNACWQAYESQEPNEDSDVPDRTLFPPPDGVRPIGSPSTGKADGSKMGARNGDDDAANGNFDHNGMPAPSTSEHGGAYSDAYREAWIEGYFEAYQIAHGKRRGIIEGIEAGRTRGEHDAELGAPPLDFDEQSPHEIEQITGKSRVYLASYDEQYRLAYIEAYQQRIVTPPPPPGPPGPPLGPRGGPGPGPGPFPPPPPPPPVPGSYAALRSEFYTAAGKIWSYMRMGDEDQADEWVDKLMDVLREAGFDV